MPHCLRHFHCVSVSPIIKSFPECFFVHLLIPVWGQIQSSKDEFFSEKNFYSPQTARVKYIFIGQQQIPKWAPFASRGTVNQIAGQVLEPAWSILGIRSHGPKTLDIAPKCGTSNGSWCMGIKGEMSGTVCVTFIWYMYIYELFIAFVCSLL